jgi:hypothetical protein
MTDDRQFHADLFAGLKALAESSFPKRCGNCGRQFESAEQFLRETRGISASATGLKESADEDGGSILEVFRNCSCGSTLMDFFSDRRDLSPAGINRRQRFEELLAFLEVNGLDRQLARLELLKVMRGEKSQVLASIRPPQNRK